MKAVAIRPLFETAGINMQDDATAAPPLCFTIRRARTVPSVSTTASSPDESDCSDSEGSKRSMTVPRPPETPLSTQYPSDLVVRNTFYEFAESRTELLNLRRTRSAPSRPRRYPNLDDVETDLTFDKNQTFERHDWAGKMEERPKVTTLQLASMLSELSTSVPEEAFVPQIGTAEVPTKGSVGHNLDYCKPCAFFWKDAGCGNGFECEYCHLCDRGSKKRRQKEKKAYLRAVHGPRT